jgi:hypothetical protein
MYRLNDVSTVSVTEIGGRGLAEVLLALVRGRRSLLELTFEDSLGCDECRRPPATCRGSGARSKSLTCGAEDDVWNRVAITLRDLAETGIRHALSPNLPPTPRQI